jgi:hypothetical protein
MAHHQVSDMSIRKRFSFAQSFLICTILGFALGVPTHRDITKPRSLSAKKVDVATKTPCDKKAVDMHISDRVQRLNEAHAKAVGSAKQAAPRVTAYPMAATHTEKLPPQPATAVVTAKSDESPASVTVSAPRGQSYVDVVNGPGPTATAAPWLKNIGYAGAGYNLFYGNPHPTESGVDPGFTDHAGQPIFDLQYTFDSRGVPQVATVDQESALPNNIIVKSEVGCKMSFTSTVTTTTTAYQNSLSASVSVGGSASGGIYSAAFSASADYQSAASNEQTSHSTMVSTVADCVVYRIELPTYSAKPGFTENFQLALNTLSAYGSSGKPVTSRCGLDSLTNHSVDTTVAAAICGAACTADTDCAQGEKCFASLPDIQCPPPDLDYSSYYKLFDTFGTHYARVIQMGARYGKVSTLSEQEVATITSHGTTVEASASASAGMDVEESCDKCDGAGEDKDDDEADNKKPGSGSSLRLLRAKALNGCKTHSRKEIRMNKRLAKYTAAHHRFKTGDEPCDTLDEATYESGSGLASDESARMVRARLGGSVSASAKVETASEAARQFQSNTESTTTISLGATPTGGGLEEWLEGATDNPMPIRYKLASICSLLPQNNTVDKQVAANCNAALTVGQYCVGRVQKENPSALCSAPPQSMYVAPECFNDNGCAGNSKFAGVPHKCIQGTCRPRYARIVDLQIEKTGTCSSGYDKITLDGQASGDLNQGNTGLDLQLCAQTSSSPSVHGICQVKLISGQPSDCESMYGMTSVTGAQGQQLTGNLNQGVSWKNLFLCYSTSGCEEFSPAPPNGGCQHWRGFGSCDYDLHTLSQDAAMVLARQRTCTDEIGSTEAGVCVCAGGVEYAHVGCGHEAFTCEQKCKGQMPGSPIGQITITDNEAGACPAGMSRIPQQESHVSGDLNQGNIGTSLYLCEKMAFNEKGVYLTGHPPPPSPPGYVAPPPDSPPPPVATVCSVKLFNGASTLLNEWAFIKGTNDYACPSDGDPPVDCGDLCGCVEFDGSSKEEEQCNYFELSDGCKTLRVYDHDLMTGYMDNEDSELKTKPIGASWSNPVSLTTSDVRGDCAGFMITFPPPPPPSPPPPSPPPSPWPPFQPSGSTCKTCTDAGNNSPYCKDPSGASKNSCGWCGNSNKCIYQSSGSSTAPRECSSGWVWNNGGCP